MRDYYRRLGLLPFADLHEIRRAYRELVRHVSSTSGDSGAAAHLDSLHRVYEVLSNQERRRIDDTRSVSGHRVTTRENAFADEVDVDFPSVSNLVGRMRGTFFGPPLARPLSAEVRLTPRQADAGVSVPLDVSLRHTCPVCGGRGEVWLDPCGVCSGSGGGLLPHQFQVVVPPGVRDGAYLHFDVTRSYAPTTLVQVRISVQ